MLKGLLPVSQYEPIVFSPSVSNAKRLLAERNFDLIIINSPLTDEMGMKFSIEVSARDNSIVMFLVKNEIEHEIYEKVYRHGVHTLPKPLTKSIFDQAMKWMITSRERLRRSEVKTSSIEDKMAEIRLVNRAKWILINTLHMTEPEAHRYIEKEAMNHCVAKKNIAENIIKTYA